MNEQTQNEQTQKLYVGNLNFDANEDQVKELFSNYGGVDEVKVVMDRFSGRSRGFAFVKMDTVESAGRAKEALHGQPFQGKNLVIDWARTQQQERSGGERRGFDRPNREFRPRGEGGWGGGRSERREYRGNSDRGNDRGGNFYSR